MPDYRHEGGPVSCPGSAAQGAHKRASADAGRDAFNKISERLDYANLCWMKALTAEERTWEALIEGTEIEQEYWLSEARDHDRAAFVSGFFESLDEFWEAEIVPVKETDRDEGNDLEWYEEAGIVQRYERDLQDERDYLLFNYWVFFTATCKGESADEAELNIKDLVSHYGQDEAERVLLRANRHWSKTVPTLWRIFRQGTDEERRIVKRADAQRYRIKSEQRQEHKFKHMMGECRCEYENDATNVCMATYIQNEISQIETRVKREIDKVRKNHRVYPQTRTACASPWEVLLS